MSGTLFDRGRPATRLDAFVDAAFAFALTLLAIAGDRIPDSVPALVEALKTLPAYALSFLLIMRFWTAHVDWQRRYGLDDATTRRLALLLVFLVLIFVYPMRMVFAVLFAFLSGGFFPARFDLGTWAHVPVLFVTFALAFGSLGTVMWALHRHAWRHRDALALGPVDVLRLRGECEGWALVPAVSALSLLLALAIPARPSSGWWIGMPGFVYFLLNVGTPLLRRRTRRRIAALESA